MLVGENKEIRIDVASADGTTTFIFDETPTLILTDPVGGITNPTVIDSSPSTQVVKHTLSAVIPVPIGGRYKLVWSWIIGSSDPIERIDHVFAYWTDVAGFMRRRLSSNTKALTDANIDEEFSVMERMLHDSFAGLAALPVYNSLVGLDQDRFDQACALLCAIKVKYYAAPNTPVGNITEWKVQQSDIKFAPRGANKDELTLEQMWFEEAVNALGRVAAIKAYYDSQKSKFRMFQVSGPSRSQKKQSSETLFSITARLLTDSVNFGISPVTTLG